MPQLTFIFIPKSRLFSNKVSFEKEKFSDSWNVDNSLLGDDLIEKETIFKISLLEHSRSSESWT